MLTLGASAGAQTPPPNPAPAPDRQAQPAPERQAPPAKDTSPVMGTLANVDATAKTLTVKQSDGKEITFKYTDTTEVTGAKDGPAGLATMKDARVTVHFTEDANKAKTATRVIVSPTQ